MIIPQAATTVVHGTDCDRWAVAGSSLQGVLRKDVTVSLALSWVASLHHSTSLSTSVLQTHFGDSPWLIYMTMLLSPELEHGEACTQRSPSSVAFSGICHLWHCKEWHDLQLGVTDESFHLVNYQSHQFFFTKHVQRRKAAFCIVAS